MEKKQELSAGQLALWGLLALKAALLLGDLGDSSQITKHLRLFSKLTFYACSFSISRNVFRVNNTAMPPKIVLLKFCFWHNSVLALYSNNI